MKTNSIHLKRKIVALWQKCCEYDKINPNEMFIVFSEDNPFLSEYNKKMKQFQELREK